MPELIWEGKYDAKGRKVTPLRVSLPFQTVETVNESARERQRTLDLFAGGRNSEWRNRLVWGDNKYVLAALLDEFAGKVDLIYIDPPFGTGQDFSFSPEVPDTDVTFVKQPSLLEEKAYRDTWGRGLDSYLTMVSERIGLMYELLASTGVLAVHLDWRIVPYYRLVLDEVFGSDHFVNELIWRYGKMSNASRRFAHSHDQIIVYHKDGNYPFHVQTGEVSEYRNRYERWVQPDNTLRYGAVAGSKDKLIAMRVKKVEERLNRPVQSDDILFDFNQEAKAYDDVFVDISIVKGNSEERTAFPTQKPEKLLRRIIGAYTDTNALVADFFSGSGTAAVAAEQLGRRWVTCDLSRFGIHTTRKRLLSTPGVRPFVIQNLGKYERQLWQVAEFGNEAAARTHAYREFILKLYQAQPIEGHAWLHGIKRGSMIHVGTVDAPVTVGDVKQIAAEFRKTIGTGAKAPKTTAIDVLGWDFAFELNEVAKQEASLANILLRFVRIPREILDKRAAEEGDVRFFELAALSLDVTQKGRIVSVRLADFMIPLDDVPDEVQRSIKNWTQWVDYWAVDWNNQDDTFHNEWQAYRTRSEKKLETETAHEYEAPGQYQVVVKVVDILGNDTTKTLDVEVT